ncbi:MAG: penicillin-binding protein activator [Proteobacteria bacterium]|nr:penicillin-binding protein activator [Pseudomonadota bacterium]
MMALLNSFSSRKCVGLTALLFLLVAFSPPTDSEAFMGFFEKGEKGEKQETSESVQEFRPVPVPGAPILTDEPDAIERAIFNSKDGTDETGIGGGIDNDGPLFGTDGAFGALVAPSEEAPLGDTDSEDYEPVVFYELRPEESESDASGTFTAEELDMELDRMLSGASTDSGLLYLARTLTARDDIAKGARAYSRLIEDFPSSPLRFSAFYELGYLRYRANRLGEARGLLQYVVKSRKAAVTLKDSARALLEEVDSIYERGSAKSDRVSIGVLLPLDGKYEKMGSAALNGILLATGAFAEDGRAVDVYVRDTGGQSAGTKAAIDDLVNKKKVRAIIGPMLSSTSEAAAKYAQNRRTPIIALSQRDGLTDIGNYVFRNSLLPARQAALVASYAYNTLGNRTFVILYPRSRYGSTLARAFAAEVERLGGMVINRTSYAPGSQDLNEELRDLFLIEEEEMAKGRRTIKEYNPTVVADALYIPDNYQTVSMVIPYLEYFNIEELQLLGSNGWNSPKLIELGKKGVRGAVFADGFFTGSEREATLSFSDKYRTLYGTEPGVLASQAYDATLLLLAAISEQGYEWMDRETLRRALVKTEGVDGSIGSISVEEGGEVAKELFLLRAERKGIVEVELDAEARAGTMAPGHTSPSSNKNGTDNEQTEEETWD